MMGNFKRLGYSPGPSIAGIGWPPCMGSSTPAVGSLSDLRGRIFPELAWVRKTLLPRTASTSGRAVHSGGPVLGAASYLQILASEMSDKLLAEILELDAELTVTLHVQTVDQLKAIKTIKG